MAETWFLPGCLWDLCALHVLTDSLSCPTPLPPLSAMVMCEQALGSGKVELPGGMDSLPLCTAYPECWELNIRPLRPVPLFGDFSTVLGPQLLAVGYVLP